MSDEDDVPSPIDLRLPRDAHTWAREADVKRPFRAHVRSLFAANLDGATRILELGPGPGLLAEHLLRYCPIESYTLFDFSRPMLELARERIGVHRATSYVVGDFKQPGWSASLAPPYDAVLAMQAVHEIRHKRHVPGLYREIHALLRPGGRLLVCDHLPMNPNLYATESEQLEAMRSAGFTTRTIAIVENAVYLIAGITDSE